MRSNIKTMITTVLHKDDKKTPGSGQIYVDTGPDPTPRLIGIQNIVKSKKELGPTFF